MPNILADDQEIMTYLDMNNQTILKMLNFQKHNLEKGLLSTDRFNQLGFKSSNGYITMKAKIRPTVIYAKLRPERDLSLQQK